jgi:hypothetical protein
VVRLKNGQLHWKKVIDGLQPVKRSNGQSVWAFSLLVVFLAWAIPSLAQTGAGSLHVLVEDASGAIVPNAKVQLTDVATSVARTQNANADGYAVFSPVERGTYNVEATRQGFSILKIEGVTIDVNQNREVIVQLKVANQAQTVEVTATTMALQTGDASVGAVVTNNEIVNLPLAERRYTDLTLLAPGVTTSTNSVSTRGPDWFVVNGTRSTMNNFLLDGMDNNQATHNDQSRSAEIIAPPPDGLTEFQVLTDNPSALYGRAAGAVIMASVKSGTNQIHGALWEFNRETALAANSWLSNHDNASKDQLVWNQPGGAIGGQIIKDKLFYFGDYEYLTSTAYSSLLGTVPVVSTPAGNGGNAKGDYSNLNIQLYDLNGNPLPDNQIPAADISTLGQKIMGLYPAPNLPGSLNSAGQPANNYGRSVALTNREHKTDFRLDYYKSSRNRFFGRYGFNQSVYNQQTLFPNPIADSGAQFGGPEYARNQSGAGGWTFIISPTMVNTVRYQYTNTGSSFTEESYGLESGTAFGFLGLPSSLDAVGSLPYMTVNNYNSLGDGNFRPQFSNPWQQQINDNFSIIKGAHSIQVGFDYRLKQDNLVDLNNRVVGINFSGAFSGIGKDAGDATADMMMGLTASATAETFAFVHQQQRISSYYIQDDWKIRKNLTLNLGMRYEYYTPMFGVGQYPNINFNLITGQLMAGPGSPTTVGNGTGVQVVPASNRYTEQPDKDTWGPRVGIAYQPSNNIVLRAGFGFYYDGEDIAGTTPLLTINPPNVYPITYSRVGTGPNAAAPTPWNLAQSFPNTNLNTTQISSTTLNINAFYPYSQVGRIGEWNLSLQYLLDSSSTLTVGYVGNSSHGMRQSFPANSAPYGVDGSVQANRPYPLVNGVNTESYFGASKFNSMQVQYERRANHGLSNLLSYTYANASDNTDDFGSSGGASVEVVEQPVGQLPYPVERGPYGMWGPDTEVPHQRLTDALVWALPFGRGQRVGADVPRALDYVVGGWSLTGILTRQTGIPFSVSLSGSGSTAATSTSPAVSWTSYTNSGGTNRPNCAAGDLKLGKTPDTPGGSWLNPAGFSVPALNSSNQVIAPGACPRNPVWGPGLVNWDQSFLKRIPIHKNMSVEFHADLFNILNHPNFATPSGTSFGASGFGLITSTVNTPRQVQLAVKFLF